MPPRSLILMRHAKQSGSATRDHERPLTDEGRRDAQRVGERLAGETPLPGLVLSSTALRCRETWAAVAVGLGASLGTDFEPTYEPALYNASLRDLLEEIAAVDDEISSLLVLAHNPGISLLALELASGIESDAAALQHGFTPATTARFDVEGPWSSLSARTARLSRFDRA